MVAWQDSWFSNGDAWQNKQSHSDCKCMLYFLEISRAHCSLNWTFHKLVFNNWSLLLMIRTFMEVEYWLCVGAKNVSNYYRRLKPIVKTSKINNHFALFLNQNLIFFEPFTLYFYGLLHRILFFAILNTNTTKMTIRTFASSIWVKM